LQIVDGKARLVGELLCDGLGACMGVCPEGAISVEEREAEAYDEKKVMVNIVASGEATLRAHLKHLRDHQQEEYLKLAIEYLKEHNRDVPEREMADKPMACGCPGSMMKDFRRERKQEAEISVPAPGAKSELRQWPTQLHLLNPSAPYFQDCDLVVSADCAPFAFGNFHSRFLKGKALVQFCPKLDTGLDVYLEKLTAIIKNNNVKSVTVVKMEVPCCSGTLKLAEQAIKNSGKNVLLKEYTISIQGEII
jgi:ferredoxin